LRSLASLSPPLTCFFTLAKPKPNQNNCILEYYQTISLVSQIIVIRRKNGTYPFEVFPPFHFLYL
jgi:hypothetical protein